MNPSLRVLFYADLTRPFVPSDLDVRPLGGSETALVRVARGLASSGWSVFVAGHPHDRAGSYDGVKYLNVEDRTWRTSEPHVVVIFRQLPHVLRPLPGKVRVLWAHDHIGIYPEMHPGILRSMLAAGWRFGYPVFGRRAPVIVAVSEWLRQCFVQYAGWPGTAVRAIRNAVDPSLFSSAHIAQSTGPLRVAYTSVPERGLSLLIQEIMPAVWRVRPDVELHVFSYQPLDAYRSHDAGRGGRITFRGGLSQAALALELARFDLWLYPTDFPETSCIAAMEAQAAGVPAITSRRYALTDTVQHGRTGILIDGRVGSDAYVQQFATATIDLLTDRSRRAEMGRQARRRILAEFTWGAVIEQWNDFLRGLADPAMVSAARTPT